jgi:glycosyltransferase involved in cell wall biosynthesis
MRGFQLTGHLDVMRVLILNYEYPPLGGGAGNATYHLLREYSGLGIEVDLVTSSEAKEEKLTPFEGITVYKININKNDEIHNQSYKDLLTYSVKAFRKAKSLKQNNEYNLVHAFFGIPCGFIALLLDIPFIVSLRGSDVPFYSDKYYYIDKFVFQYLSKIIWSKSCSTIANSSGLALLANQTAPKQVIKIIPNGVDTVVYRPSNQSIGNNEGLTLLFCGRLIERKGVNFLVEAFLEFNNSKKHHLILAGDGPLKQKLEERVRESGQDGQVEFLGVVQKRGLPEIYRRADLFVLPSKNEGMSNSILEAMATGLPILTTNTGGCAELVDENGIIIEKENSGSILNALKMLDRDREAIRYMGEASRRRANEMNWLEIAKNYIKIYQEYIQ